MPIEVSSKILKKESNYKSKKPDILHTAVSCHCVKSVRIRSFSGAHFPRTFRHTDWVRRDTSYLLVFSSNAGKCGKNADQNNSEYRHFLRSMHRNKNMLKKKYFHSLINTSRHRTRDVKQFNKVQLLVFRYSLKKLIIQLKIMDPLPLYLKKLSCSFEFHICYHFFITKKLWFLTVIGFQQTMGQWRGGSLTQPMLITAHYLVILIQRSMGVLQGGWVQKAGRLKQWFLNWKTFRFRVDALSHCVTLKKVLNVLSRR